MPSEIQLALKLYYNGLYPTLQSEGDLPAA